MTALTALWLPVLVSALAVFVASSVLHMGPFWHRGDYPAPPEQERLRAALRPFALPPGDYLLPRPRDAADARSAEHMEKLRQGPVLMMTVLPSGGWSLAPQLVQWFVYVLAVAFVSAYVAGRALPPGAHYLEAFRFAGTTTFVAHAVGLWQMSIWYRRSWSLTLKANLDGLLYALITGGVFGALWP